MTTPRVWLYSKLTTFPGLVNLIGGASDPRVFVKKAMTSNVEDHPFLVYKLGYKANEDLSEHVPGGDVYRQFAQIYVHDYTDTETGDYTRIDLVISQIKLAIHGQGSSEHGVITAKVIEVSQDLNDETLNTIFKYVRVQLTTKEV